jgi:hypothetical protein
MVREDLTPSFVVMRQITLVLETKKAPISARKNERTESRWRLAANCSEVEPRGDIIRASINMAYTGEEGTLGNGCPAPGKT